MTAGVGSTVDPALLGEIAAAAAALGRADLAGDLRRATEAASPLRRVVVLGAFKAGKSRLVNELVGAEVCSVDVARSTAVPTIVRGIDGPAAAVVVRSPIDDEDVDADRTRTVVSVAEAKQLQSSDDADLRWIEVGLDRPLLRAVTIVDTPAWGATGPAAAYLESAATGAAAVVFVKAALRELTASEIDLLARLRGRCPRVVVAETGIDLDRRWARVTELDRGHLDEAGFDDLELIATSAALRRAGRGRVETDPDAAEELERRSGYPALLAALDRAMDLDAGARSAAADEVVVRADAVLDVLGRGLRARLAGLDDPEQIAALAETAAAAKQRVDELRRSDRWRQALVDGVTAITADADFDLRDRLRGLGKGLDERVEAIDPAEGWSDLHDWLQSSIAEQLAAHHDLIEQRTRQLGDRVLAAIDADAAFGELAIGPLDLALVGPDAALDVKKAGVGGSAFTAMRGTYGSIAMFGMFTSMIGLSLLNPITVVATVGMSRKAIRDERQRQLQQRRAAARAAGRAAIEEANHVAGKWSRDQVRGVNRLLREEITARVEELQASADAAHAAARAALQGDEQGRRERRQRMTSHLTRVDELRARLGAGGNRS